MQRPPPSPAIVRCGGGTSPAKPLVTRRSKPSLTHFQHHSNHHRSDSCPHVVGVPTFLPPSVDVVASVRTVIRIRPLPSTRSSATSSTSRPWLRCRHTLDDKAIEVIGAKPSDNKLYMADHVLSEDATQEDVFATVGAPAVDALVAGYNGSVFAYGQSGSGKTYSMHGEVADGWRCGLVPRILQALFEVASAAQQFECVVSFVEIYNEKIYDLLDVRAVDPKNIREDTAVNQVFVQDLVQVPVSSAADAIEWLHKGMSARKVVATAMNAASSRGHGVFSIKLRHQISDHTSRKAVLHCVDLAGGDKNVGTTDLPKVTKDVKEASHINKSLSCLVGVLSALVDVSSGVKRHVPYRDSKLTFLLREALGGNAKTTFMATVSSDERWMTDTLSTLQLVDRTTHITSRVKPNDSDGVERMVQSLQREVATLKEFLALERHHLEPVVVPTIKDPTSKCTLSKEDSLGEDIPIIPVVVAPAVEPATKAHNEQGPDKGAAAVDRAVRIPRAAEVIEIKRDIHVRSTPKQAHVAVATDDEAPPATASSWELLPSMEVAVVLFVVGYCVGRYFRPPR